MASRIIRSTPAPADTQSVLPRVIGVPWWGAVLIAAGFTAVGAIIDVQLNSSLGLIYNSLFAIGCILAVLAVRRRALFTAAVQPPLITLVIGLIALYSMVLRSSDSAAPRGMRQAVLEVVLPFSNLFPWIVGTFVLCVLIALARWLITRPAVAAEDGSGSSQRRPAPQQKQATKRAAAAKSGSKKSVSAKKGSAKTGSVKTGSAKTAAPASKSKPKPKSKMPRTSDADAPKASSRPAPAAAAQSGPADLVGTKPAEATTTAAAPVPARPSASRPPAPKAPAPQSSVAPSTGPAPTAARPATAPPAERPEPQRRPTEQQRPPTDSRPASDERARPQRTAPSTGGARPVRRDPSVVGQGNRPVRRAQPQVIPPRADGSERPRRTAGQLRDNGGMEDLTLGIDD